MTASPRLLSCCSAANGKQVNNYGLAVRRWKPVSYDWAYAQKTSGDSMYGYLRTVCRRNIRQGMATLLTLADGARLHLNLQKAISIAQAEDCHRQLAHVADAR